MARWLLLVAVLLPLLGFYRDIPRECAVDMHLPPMNGTPQPEGQVISYRPTATTTFRLSYGTSPNKLDSYADGGANGQETAADVRGEFVLAGLDPDTKHYWLIECSEVSKWKRGWRGSFLTTPAAGGTLNIVFATDLHYTGSAVNSGSEHGTQASRTMKGIHLLSSRVQDAHVYLDGGDTFGIHIRNAGGYILTDDFGRSLGENSVPESALTSDEEDGFAEARYSFTLRRMHIFLRFVSSIFSRGNHDAGGGFGGNDPAVNASHWQLRARPWVTTDKTVDVESGGDLATGTGIFNIGTHGMGDADGPYRWQNAAPANPFEAPELDGCEGARAATNSDAEWYVRTVDADNFKLSYGAALNGCTGGTHGTGDGTLLRGSDMQAASKAVTAEYLPLQNDTYAHGYGGATAEDHVMGPVPLSDYALVINLDEYDFTGDTGYTTEPLRFPIDGRSNGAAGGWTLGPDQLAGVLAAIAEIQDGGGAYENVEVLLLLTHSGMGGFGTVGYSYGRGSLCEVDTVCDVGGADCIIDSNCGEGACGAQDCSADFAHAEMQAIHEAAAAMVIRASGVAIWLMGHDHSATFGEKGSSGVYYYHGGQVGMTAGAGTSSDATHVKRYDFNGDGIPAFRRHFCALGDGNCPAGEQDALVEVGSEHRGFSLITLRPAAENPSTKTEVDIDYIINGYNDYPTLHGTSPSGFPILIEGP